MKKLLGLNNRQFLIFKRAEQWLRRRNMANTNYSTKEKYVEFAKELFKIWDEDNSGSLELEELTL